MCTCVSGTPNSFEFFNRILGDKDVQNIGRRTHELLEYIKLIYCSFHSFFIIDM